jgi:hypothetical protein
MKKLTPATRILYSMELKVGQAHRIHCVPGFGVCGPFVIAPVSFPHSCLSLGAET